MGWFTYYRLSKKYNGDLTKATKEELDFARRDNPNTPPEAKVLAERKWRENKRSQLANQKPMKQTKTSNKNSSKDFKKRVDELK